MKKFGPLAFVAACLAFSIGASGKPSDVKPPAKIELTLRANPAMAFAPARITLTAQLKGGTNDNEELYCPTVEWDWGDGTISQSSADCDPFQPNKSDIQRSFLTQHIYKAGGEYTVKLLLKKSERIVAEAAASLNITRAMGDNSDIIR